MRALHKAVGLLAAGAILMGSSIAQASTVAWWRFEEQPAGTPYPLNGYQNVDYTGNGNTFQTFAAGTAPNYVADNPGGVINPALPNARSLDFPDPAPGFNTRDIFFGSQHDLSTHTFNQFTIEASVKFHRFGGYQTFICKEGYRIPNSNGDLASLYFQSPNPGDVGNKNIVSIRAHQADGTFVALDGTTALVTETWYNLAAVSDGTTLKLYIQLTPGAAYNLEASAPFVGQMYNQNRGWCLGRGLYANNVGDAYHGLLDEVRVSDTALDPAVFLFAPPPPPPSAPTNLAATGGANAIALTWTAPTTAVTYNVYRGTAAGQESSTPLVTGVLSPNYVDTTATAGTYYYKVTGVNGNGESLKSNEASATSQTPITGTGDGLTGSYYLGDATDFSPLGSTPFLVRVDPAINFSIDNGGVNFSPSAFPAGVPHDHYSVHWAGKFQSPITGNITFTKISDDGARLYVNGNQIINDANYQGPNPVSATVSLAAGQTYDIALDYFQGGGGATIQLLYSYIGQPQTIIPAAQLYSYPAGTAPTAPVLAAQPAYKAVILHWNGAAGSPTSYTLKRGTATGVYTTTLSGLTGNSYTDTSVVGGTPYFYTLTAINAAGAGTPSNEATATPVAGFTPIAYWRFEDGTADTHMIAQPNFVTADLSGNGNTLQTFADATAPTYRADNPGAVQNPFAPNTLSLDFSEPHGANAQSRDLYTTTEGINNHLFNQFTLEASFKFNVLTGYQTIIGKAGSAYAGDGNGANAGLYFQMRDPGSTGGVPYISIATHQASGLFTILLGTTPLVAGQWYNAAAVMDGSVLSLYLQTTPGGPYHLENYTPFNGPIENQDQIWTVGRGTFNNNIADQFNGLADEIRISDVALLPSQFLFVSQGATVTGRIKLEGINDLSAINPAVPAPSVKFEFRTPGTTTVVYTATATLTPVGSMSPYGTYSLSGVPAGTYDIAIKGSKQLRVVQTNIPVSGTIALADATLPSGDASNDNTVDIGDFGILVNAYGSDVTISGSGYNAAADFDYNGVVDIGDFGILVNEYGNSGAN